MSILVFLAALGAILRLTRISTDDLIFEPVRDFFAVRIYGDSTKATIAHWFHDLLKCPWCIGFWLSAAVIGLGWLSGGATWFLLPALVLSASWLNAVASTIVYRVEGD